MQKKGVVFTSTTEPIKDKKQLRQMAVYWLKGGRVRNYAFYTAKDGLKNSGFNPRPPIL